MRVDTRHINAKHQQETPLQNIVKDHSPTASSSSASANTKDEINCKRLHTLVLRLL